MESGYLVAPVDFRAAFMVLAVVQYKNGIHAAEEMMTLTEAV